MDGTTLYVQWSFQLTVSISTSLIRLLVVRLIKLISPSVLTTSSVSTIYVTIWQCHQQTLYNARHNYAIVDEVDSVLIDDARTPLIISGPVPKGDVQMFEEFQPLVQSLYEVQRKQATELLSEARHKVG